MESTLFVVGCIWVSFGLLLKAEDLASELMFKVLPFTSGVFVCHYAAKSLGWI